MAGVGMASLSVKVSWDTLPRLPYNPHNRRKPKTPVSLKPSLNPSPVTLIASPTSTVAPVSVLLRRDVQNSTLVKSDESFMGYDIWLPSPPKVKKPRSVYNAASMAYIGDCIFELYARRHFLFPPLNMEEYNDRVMAVVRCEAQDAFLQKLLDDNFLSEEERDVLRWGKNIGSAKTRTKKRAGVAVYNRASSLETLVGYLYLTDVNRLEKVMCKLGFSTDGSTLSGLQETDTVKCASNALLKMYKPMVAGLIGQNQNSPLAANSEGADEVDTIFRVTTHTVSYHHVLLSFRDVLIIYTDEGIYLQLVAIMHQPN